MRFVKKRYTRWPIAGKIIKLAVMTAPNPTFARSLVLSITTAPIFKFTRHFNQLILNRCGFLLVRYIRGKIVLVRSVVDKKLVRYPEYGGCPLLGGQ